MATPVYTDPDCGRCRNMATSTRYQVGDPVCGNVDHYQTRDAAIRAASRHQDRHQSEGAATAVTVFDVMAHHGAAEEWDAWGNPIAYRALKA